MKSLLKRILLVTLIGIVVAARASAATAEITLVSGSSSIVISDNSISPSDLNPAIGSILYTNPDFNGWNVNFIGGQSNSTAATPFGIDLGGFVSAGLVAPSAPLEIIFSDLNFNTPTNGFINTYGATVIGTGSTSETAWVDTSNTILGTGSVIGNLGPFNSSSPCCGGTTGGGPNVTGGAPYSLTLQEIFNPSSGTSFSVDATITALSPAPEPTTMMLFATGMLGLAGIFHRQKHLVLH